MGIYSFEHGKIERKTIYVYNDMILTHQPHTYKVSCLNSRFGFIFMDKSNRKAVVASIDSFQFDSFENLIRKVSESFKNTEEVFVYLWRCYILCHQRIL